MGRSACLLSHGILRVGTTDAVELSFNSTVTYSPQATTKNPH
jgi:hypothetical protein